MENHFSIKKIFWKILISLLFFFFAHVSYAQTHLNADQEKACQINGINYQLSIQFIEHLQTAIKTDNKRMIANMGNYPILFNYHSNKIYIRHKNNFIKMYPKIFSSKMKAEIINQDPNDIFCNYKGAMIANGMIWFNTTNNQASIFAINKID